MQWNKPAAINDCAACGRDAGDSDMCDRCFDRQQKFIRGCIWACGVSLIVLVVVDLLLRRGVH